MGAPWRYDRRSACFIRYSLSPLSQRSPSIHMSPSLGFEPFLVRSGTWKHGTRLSISARVSMCSCFWAWTRCGDPGISVHFHLWVIRERTLLHYLNAHPDVILLPFPCASSTSSVFLLKSFQEGA